MSGIDSSEIQRLLPHRYPFLLVDRIERCEPGHRIVGWKCVSRHECKSLGGQPGRQTMPDALVLEVMAQVAVILTFKTLDMSERSGQLFFFAGIDKTRFQRRPRIGDRMIVEARVERIMKARGVGRFSTRATIDDELVAQATMLAAVRAHSDDQDVPAVSGT